MSVPSSMRVGPFAPAILPKKRYIIFYIFLIWVSIIPCLLELWFYWQITWDPIRPIHFYIYLPLLFFVIYVTAVFTSLIFAKMLLEIVNLIHKPREGVFLRDNSDKDYLYWTIRNTIKKWPVWLAHKFPFPFLDNICFKMFGVKTKISNSLFEGWVDTELIEFGENVVVGQASHITSALILGNLLIIRKTVIEDDVRIGTHSYVMPGTHIGEKAVLATWSLTTVGQKLESGYVYAGVPCIKYKKNLFFEDGLEDKIDFKIDDEEKLEKMYRKLYREHQDDHHSYLERRRRKREKKKREEKRWENL
ncbi:MAG: hypothetical protein EU521_00245 [Promethearchaeota archaeon]|nr:MAG: hypothetical protein EU521_00245 [Candidatus Lokiarchaeota archaeon]